MALTLPLTNSQKNWQLYWNRVLVFLFIATYFLNDITRYKHLIVILMTITSFIYLFKRPKHYLPIFKTFLFGSIVILTATIFISLFQTPDLKTSLKEINNSVVENMLLCTFTIPVLLRDEGKEMVSKIIFSSFLTALILQCLSELVFYYYDYKQGFIPFTNYRHRSVSDSLVFLFPVLLNLWLIKSIKYKVAFIVLGGVFLFLVLGTLSRGAWLAIFISSLVWIFVYRQWKLSIVGIILAALALTVVFFHKEKPSMLATKMQQTDSSYRYTNGTQGSGFDLILENPVSGYGFGNAVYHSIYNKRVADYPHWTFRKSIGPHNLILFVWFGAGLPGLAGLLLVYISIMKECVSSTFKRGPGSPYNAYIILLLSFIGYFIVRGNFEQIELNLLGILAGLLLAMKNKPA